MEKRVCPRPQEIYRHFKDKNKLYQIITLAVNSETEEKMVVYQALYGDYTIYVRPLDMFMSRVDRIKYPEADSEYRFEKPVSTVEVEKQDTDILEKDDEAGCISPNEDLIAFLEADTYEERRNLLIHLKPRMTDRLIDDISASIDVTVEPGDIDERYRSLLSCVDTLGRYEVTRF